jgi:hypothetical protein
LLERFCKVQVSVAESSPGAAPAPWTAARGLDRGVMREPK